MVPTSPVNEPDLKDNHANSELPLAIVVPQANTPQPPTPPTPAPVLVPYEPKSRINLGSFVSEYDAARTPFIGETTYRSAVAGINHAMRVDGDVLRDKRRESRNWARFAAIAVGSYSVGTAVAYALKDSGAQIMLVINVIMAIVVVYIHRQVIIEGRREYRHHFDGTLKATENVVQSLNTRSSRHGNAQWELVPPRCFEYTTYEELFLLKFLTIEAKCSTPRLSVRPRERVGTLADVTSGSVEDAAASPNVIGSFTRCLRDLLHML
jgi:hypothetical protein